MKTKKESSKRKCFLMMRYRKDPGFKKAHKIIKRVLASFDIELVIAEQHSKDPLVWKNVTGCMDECTYGIALFDDIADYEIHEARPNPNIVIELGYMLCQKKPCMLLIDTRGGQKLGAKLFTDIQGFTANTFDSGNLERTLRPELERWLTRQISIAPLLATFRNLFPKSKIAKRLAIHSRDKQRIATHIVDKWTQVVIRHPVLMDSGSSVAAVAEAVIAAGTNLREMTFVTNNLLVSTMLGCHSHHTRHICCVLPGKVDDEFASVFSNTVAKDIAASGAKTAVLSCTGFDPKSGPQAGSDLNRSFKRAAFKQCRMVYLLVTRGRIRTASDPTELVFPNLRQWKKICSSGRLKIIVSPRFSPQALSKLPIHLQECLELPKLQAESDA